MTEAAKYTFAGDPAIEEKVNEIIREITDEIVVHLRPRSVILIGSFGRGEAIVNIDGGKPKFISDCDVIVISNRYISRKAMEKLSSELTRKTSLEVGISGIELSFYFMLSKMFPRASGKIWKPSIDNYDMKYGSKVVYGENFLQTIPDFKSEDIPIWEGIRLMLNRMIESLKVFSIDYFYATPLEEEKRKLLSWINKIILACQDALLISIKKYHHSYKIRNDIFQEAFPTRFAVLSRQLPQFLPLAIQATRCRLNRDEPYAEDILGLWFDAAGICDKVFRYIIEGDMGITFDTYLEFQEKYLRHPHIKRKYYRGLTPFPVCQNLRSVAKILVCARELPRLKSVTKFWAPWVHIMYSTMPLVYYAVSRDGQVNDNLLLRARENFTPIRKLRPANPNPRQEWGYIKEQAVDLWQAICY